MVNLPHPLHAVSGYTKPRKKFPCGNAFICTRGSWTQPCPILFCVWRINSRALSSKLFMTSISTTPSSAPSAADLTLVFSIAHRGAFHTGQQCSTRGTVFCDLCGDTCAAGAIHLAPNGDLCLACAQQVGDMSMKMARGQEMRRSLAHRAGGGGMRPGGPGGPEPVVLPGQGPSVRSGGVYGRPPIRQWDGVYGRPPTREGDDDKVHAFAATTFGNPMHATLSSRPSLELRSNDPLHHGTFGTFGCSVNSGTISLQNALSVDKLSLDSDLEDYPQLVACSTARADAAARDAWVPQAKGMSTAATDSVSVANAPASSVTTASATASAGGSELPGRDLIGKPIMSAGKDVRVVAIRRNPDAAAEFVPLPLEAKQAHRVNVEIDGRGIITNVFGYF